MVKRGDILTKRKSFGLSQNEIAEYLGISRPTFQKIETGKRKPTPEEKEKMTRLFQELSGDTTSRNNIPQKNIEKFKNVVLYILEKVGARPNVGLTVLYKLLYFIDFDYYEKFEEQLMGLTYVKNTHGPTPREFKTIVDTMIQDMAIEKVKSSYFTFEQKKFLPRIEPDLSQLTGREIEVIDSVLSRYADKSARELSDISHRDTPWKTTKDGKDIDYELAFYRSDEFSVAQYDEL